jgi:hypothetical protein
MRRMDFMGTNDQDPSQQLKQVKLAIVELYQENRELRQQLATKTIEVSAVQGHEGNVMWLKRQLREVHRIQSYNCVKHRGCQKKGMQKHSRECEATEEKARAALASEQKKQD